MMAQINKLSKKAQKELNNKNRTRVYFNTGTRVHKTDKTPSRARRKELERRCRDYV